MLSSASGFRRMGAALALVAAPLLFIAADVISPAWSDDTAEFIAEVAESPSAQSASGVLFTLGMAVMVAGAIGIAHVIRGRGVVLANIGLALAILGLGVFPAITFTGVIDSFAVDTLAAGDYEALMDAGEESVGFIVILAIALLGGIISLLLLAIAAGRSGLVPWWVAAVLVLAVLSLIAGGDSQGLALASDALQLVGFGYIASRLFSMSDEEWERPPHHWGGPAPGGAQPA